MERAIAYPTDATDYPKISVEPVSGRLLFKANVTFPIRPIIFKAF
jgi:hypothetical protein